MRRAASDARDVVVLQRVIPHYRVPLFEGLYDRYGVKVVTARRPPEGSFLQVIDPEAAPWAIPSDYVFPTPGVAERADVPVRWVLETLQPFAVIAEFGLRISSSYQLPVARRLGRLSRLAFWSHGWQMGRGVHRPVDRLVQLARLPAFATADLSLTYSQEGADWIRAHLPRHRVISLGNAIDIAPIQRAARSASPQRSGHPQLLTVGRLTEDKHLDLLIDAVAILKPRYPELRLTIVGDGPQKENLTAMARQRAGDSVRFLGAIYTEALLAPHFVGADLFVIGGAAGLSVNHALAYGLPIAAFARSPAGPYHHPEIEHVVDGVTGVLARPFTSQALADAIARSLEGETLTSMRKAVARYVEQHADMEVVLANFGRAIEALLV